MIEEEKINKSKEKNRKIFPIYKMFSWDLLFYYSISFLFLHQAKGLSAPDIFLGNAFYPIFKVIFQLFAPLVINGLGKRKSTILGNIFISISILIMILLGGKVTNLIISNLVMAIGFVLKGICEACILKECVNTDKNLSFSKIDSKGSVYYYIFDAISSAATGFLFVVNPYVPMYLCFAFCIIATLISFKFEQYEEKKQKVKKEPVLDVLTKKINIAKKEYAFILKSKRLHALLLFMCLFNGVMYIRSDIASNIFVDIGIIGALLAMSSTIATSKQNFIHKKLRNKVLTFFSIGWTVAYIIIGIMAILKINYTLTIIIVLLMMILQKAIKGPYNTLIKKYLNSFSNEHIAVKIYSCANLMEDLGAMLASFMVSILLRHTTVAYASLIIGIVSLILFIILLDYMKTRIGLKPEEYRKQDIEFNPKENAKVNVVQIDVGLDERGKTNVRIY